MINEILISKSLPLNSVKTNPRTKKGIKIPYIDKNKTEISNWENAFLPYKGFNNISRKFKLVETKVTLSKVKK